VEADEGHRAGEARDGVGDALEIPLGVLALANPGATLAALIMVAGIRAAGRARRAIGAASGARTPGVSLPRRAPHNMRAREHHVLEVGGGRRRHRRGQPLTPAAAAIDAVSPTGAGTAAATAVNHQDLGATGPAAGGRRGRSRPARRASSISSAST
jgi:hypothetical protein